MVLQTVTPYNTIQYNKCSSAPCTIAEPTVHYDVTELDMDWIHPWIGLGQDFEETLWIGLGPMTENFLFFFHLYIFYINN